MPGPIDYSAMKIQPDPDTREWWEGVKQKRLLVRKCNACGYRFFPPYPTCPSCASMELGWHQAQGAGVIYSYNVVAYPILASFEKTVPYVTAVIELTDCGNPDGSVVRTVGVILDGEEKVGINVPVEVVFEKSSDSEYVMPRWRVSGTSPNTWRFRG